MKLDEEVLTPGTDASKSNFPEGSPSDLKLSEDLATADEVRQAVDIVNKIAPGWPHGTAKVRSL